MVSKTLTLSAKSRGFHLVTDEILNQLADMPRVNIGLLHLLLQHTSASLTLNENCDPTVRHDMERFFSAPFPITEIMSMTMRSRRYAFSYQILNAGNIACIAGA